MEKIPVKKLTNIINFTSQTKWILLLLLLLLTSSSKRTTFPWAFVRAVSNISMCVLCSCKVAL